MGTIKRAIKNNFFLYFCVFAVFYVVFLLLLRFQFSISLADEMLAIFIIPVIYSAHQFSKRLYLLISIIVLMISAFVIHYTTFDEINSYRTLVLFVGVVLLISEVIFRSQSRIRKIQDNLRITLNSIGDAVISTDLEGRIMQMNPVAEELTGWKKFECLGKELSAVFKIKERQTQKPCENPVRRVFETGNIVGLANDTVLIAKDGTERQIADSAAPIRNEKGEITGVVLVFRDVTYEYAQREKIARNEAMLARTEGIAHVGSWEWDIETDTVTWSDELFRIFQRDPEQGAPPVDEHPQIFHPDDNIRLEKAIEKAVKDGTSYEFELRIIRGDGEVRHCFAAGYPEKGMDGKTVRLYGFVQDITEMKEAQDSLHETERRYQEIFEGSRDGFVMVNLDGGIIDANQAFCQMLGYTLEELQQIKNFYEFTPERWREWERKEIWNKRLLQQGYSGIYEKEYIRKDGSVFPVELQSYTVFDKEGNPYYLWGVSRDITEKKLAKEALQESEKKFRAVIEQAADCLILHDLDSHIYDVNPYACKTYGYSREELLNMKVSDLDPNYDERAEGGTFYNQLVPYVPIMFEARQQKKDGTIIPVEVRLSLINMSDKQLVLGLCRDVSERKRAEQALRESEERYRLLADNTVDCIWLMDLDTTFRYVNPACMDLLGYTPDEMIGSRLEKYCDEANHTYMMNIIQDALSRMPELRGTVFEAVLRKRDGEAVYVEIRGKINTDEEGNPVSLQGVTRDISERKRNEEEKKKIEEQLRQSQKMESIGTLAGGIAHDFNNILMAILGYSQVLLNEMGPENPFYKDIEEINRAGERAASLTQQLLAFSRRQMIQPIIIDLNRKVYETHNMLNRLLGEDIDIKVHTDPDLKPVLADPGQIDQIILNIAVNARDAMPKGGRFLIETANTELDEAYCSKHDEIFPGHYVMISFSDTGRGIPKESLARIFDPFYTTKDKAKGTGLGLSTVYGIVKQNKGHISVYSEVGRGTIFKVFFPCVDQSPCIQSSDNILLHDYSGTESILVVEDDETVLHFLMKILTFKGYTVYSAGNYDEALKQFDENEGQIDLLITDVILPVHSGKEIAETLSRKCPGLHVIYMSGYTDNAIAHHNVIEEGVHFIQKPFTAENLLKKIRERLDAD